MYFRGLLGSLTWGGHAACSMRESILKDIEVRPESIHKPHSALCCLTLVHIAAQKQQVDFHRDVNSMQIPCL